MLLFMKGNFLSRLFKPTALELTNWKCNNLEETWIHRRSYFNIKSQFDNGERDLFELGFAVATWCFISGSQCFFMRNDICNFCKKGCFEQQSQCNISCKWLRKYFWKRPHIKVYTIVLMVENSHCDHHSNSSMFWTYFWKKQNNMSIRLSFIHY